MHVWAELPRRKFWNAVVPPVVATNEKPPWLRVAAFSFFCSKVASPPTLKACLPFCHEKLSEIVWFKYWIRINWFEPSVLSPVMLITGIMPLLFSGNTSGIVTPNAALVFLTPSAGVVLMLLLLK